MKTGKSDPEQHKRFIETARALECDEDKERFEEKLKRIAKSGPPTQQPLKSEKPRANSRKKVSE